jgi:carboxyl-terminal processing protease
MVAATMTGMVAALNDNHARSAYSQQQPPGEVPGDEYGLGGTISPSVGLAEYAPGAALPPLTVTSVDPRSPFARDGIRPGMF